MILQKKLADEKNDKMPIRHQRLFFRTDEVSYLIVVFLVLVTLTSFRSSFSTRQLATEEKSAIIGKVRPWMVSFFCCIFSYLLDSHLT